MVDKKKVRNVDNVSVCFHRDLRFRHFLCPIERLWVRSTFFQTSSVILLNVLLQVGHVRFFQVVMIAH
jgi:hypothetical protein